MPEGEVDYFNESGGYGFIKSDALDDGVFFHLEDVGDKDINEGDLATFEYESYEKGPRATSLELLGHEQSERGQPKEMQNQILTGTVTTYSDTGGYGFIESEEVDEEVLFYMSELEADDLDVGDSADFRIEYTDKGPQATSIEFTASEAPNEDSKKTNQRSPPWGDYIEEIEGEERDIIPRDVIEGLVDVEDDLDSLDAEMVTEVLWVTANLEEFAELLDSVVISDVISPHYLRETLPPLEDQGWIEAKSEGLRLTNQSRQKIENRLKSDDWDSSSSHLTPLKQGRSDLQETHQVSPSTTMILGTVDFFHETSGYGFITCDRLEDDVFFHMNEVGDEDPEPGDEVLFEYENSEEGPRAETMQLVSSENRTDIGETSNGEFHESATDNASSIGFSAPPAPSVSGLEDATFEYPKLDFERRIGSGGNAEVHEVVVETEQGESTIAVKQPHIVGDDTVHPEKRDRIIAEARTWEALDDHPYIVDIIDYGNEPVAWIAMEHMEAGDLGDRAGKISIEKALGIALAIVDAVAEAHRKGVVHQDLKPANVLFTENEDGEEVPKLADWGLSKRLMEESRSTEGMTVEYAAPEQFDGEFGQTDNVTDVYQLGAVLYELFTGKPPFEGSMYEVMDAIKNRDPEPPSEVADVPPDVDEIVLKALAKNRGDRYERAILLRRALQKLQTDEGGEETERIRSKAVTKESNGVTSQGKHNGEPQPVGGTNGEQTSSTVLTCPECGLSANVSESAARPGDICPYCEKGYLVERS